MPKYLKYTLLALLWGGVAAYLLYAGGKVRRHRAEQPVTRIEVEVVDSTSQGHLVSAAMVRGWISDSGIPTIGTAVDEVDLSGIETLIDAALASDDPEQMRDALQELKRLQAPYLNWTGKAERTSVEVDTVSLHVHERVDPATILANARKRLKGEAIPVLSRIALLAQVVDVFNVSDGADAACWEVEDRWASGRTVRGRHGRVSLQKKQRILPKPTPLLVLLYFCGRISRYCAHSSRRTRTLTGLLWSALAKAASKSFTLASSTLARTV